jgi:hypothetical protein
VYDEGMICGRVQNEGPDEWRLTLYTTRRKRRHVLAIVIGSEAYLASALRAAGLGGLAEDWGWREATLISRKPAYRHAKRSR